MAARIAPLDPPYEPDIQAAFDRIMPPDVAPLGLFRTVARNGRVFGRLMAGGLLDKGSLSLRQREILIDRTCAVCGAEYEWGVHVAFFADRVGFTTDQIAATVSGDRAVWDDRECLLLDLADALHAHARIDDALWTALAAAFTDQQLIEAITLVGYYHAIAFLVNGLQVEPEAYAPGFPAT